PGERFEEGRGGPEDLRGGRPARGAGAESAVKLLGDGRRVRLTVQQGLDLFWRVAPAAGLANRFLQRIERDALAVGEASAGKNKRFTADTPGELLDQSRLPETCLTNYRHGHGHPLTAGPRAARRRGQPKAHRGCPPGGDGRRERTARGTDRDRRSRCRWLRRRAAGSAG